MQPRGKTKQLIEVMQAQPEKVLWSRDEVAEAMGIERKAVSAQLGAALRHEWLHKHPGDGREVYFSLQPAANDEDTGEPQPFAFCIHSDGDIDLQGLIELDNGALRMTAEMVRQLKKFITWMPA